MMETGPDPQAVDNFLRLARGANNKQEFMNRVREFDQKFLDAYPSPNMPPPPQIPKSASLNGQHKTSNPTPIKNPFAVQPEQKYRQAPRQHSFTNMNSHYDMEAQQSRVIQGGMMPPTPHSRSQTNFYRQAEYPPTYRGDFEELQYNFANHYTTDQMAYMQPNSLDRSYPQLPTHTPKHQQRIPPPSNHNYVPTNQFLTTYEQEEPDYVKYYKKGRNEVSSNPKMGLGMAGRGNPFKQNA